MEPVTGAGAQARAPVLVAPPRRNRLSVAPGCAPATRRRTMRCLAPDEGAWLAALAGPADDLAIFANGTGAAVAHADRTVRVVAADANRVGRVLHPQVAERAVVVRAPAVDLAAGGEPAGGVLARRDVHERVAAGDGNGRRDGVVRDDTVAELAVVIPAPAVGRTARGDATGVPHAEGEFGEGMAARHGVRLPSGVGIARREAGVPERGEAPAVRRACGREAAPVECASVHPAQPHITAERRDRRVCARRGRAAELIRIVVSPAVDHVLGRCCACAHVVVQPDVWTKLMPPAASVGALTNRGLVVPRPTAPYEFRPQQ